MGRNRSKSKGVIVAAPELSVVIVNYQTPMALVACLRSLPPGLPVCVVDNASGDSSVQAARVERPTADIVALPTNRGFSAAVNVGAQRCKTPWLLVLNADVMLPHAAPTQMLARADALGADILGFRQVDELGRLQLSVGPAPGFGPELMRRFIQRRFDGGSRFWRKRVDHWLSAPRDVPWVSGAAMLIRRDIFDRLSGFDENFFLYFEDCDFCLRATALGARVVFDPTITLRHSGGVSMRKNVRLAARAYRESQLYYWRKHRGAFWQKWVYWGLWLRGLTPRQLAH